jgi:cytochrome c553
VTTISAHAQEIKGDAKAAEQKIAMCIGCHGIKGYQASFPEIYRVPMISGQNAKYIVSALNAYQKGERKHPTMRGISASLTDQDMADLGAYYEQHGKTEPVATPPRHPMPRWQPCCKRAPAFLATVTTSPSRLTPATPRLPVSTKIFCLWRSNPTRLKTSPPGAATMA